MKLKKIWFLPVTTLGLIALPTGLAASCGSEAVAVVAKAPQAETVAQPVQTAQAPVQFSQDYKWNGAAFKNSDEVRNWAATNLKSVNILRNEYGGNKYWEVNVNNIRIGFTSDYYVAEFVGINKARGYENVNGQDVTEKEGYISKDFFKNSQLAEYTEDGFWVAKNYLDLSASSTAIRQISSGNNHKWVLTADSQKGLKYEDVPELYYSSFESDGTPRVAFFDINTKPDGKKEAVLYTLTNIYSYLLINANFNKLEAKADETWFELTYQIPPTRWSTIPPFKIHFWSIDDFVNFVIADAQK